MRTAIYSIALFAAILTNTAFATVLDFRNEGLVALATVNGDEWLDIGVELSTPDISMTVGCGSDSAACVGSHLNNVDDFDGRMIIRFVEPNTTNQSSTVNVNVDFCCEGNAGGTNSTLYDINGQLITTFTDEDISYQGGTPVGWIEVQFAFDAIYVIEFDNEIIEVSDRATFTVTKDFSDDNPSPVEVQLSCNSGLPLEQSFVIVDDASNAPSFGGVTFVVTNIPDEGMNCTVTETPVNGYSPGYLASGDSQSDDDDSQNPGCNFISVSQGDQNACVITNSLHSKEAHVNKKWMLIGDADLIDPAYRLVLFCDGEILNGTPQGQSGIWYMELYDGDSLGTADHDFQPDVYPNWDGGTECWVTETVYSSSVEPSNGCGTEAAPGLLVEIDGPEPSCIITNTAFFEGIPTLNQYGLAIMALLMLGVGIVGFRRFM